MGHTHKNLCKFELAKCRRITRGLEAPEIIKTGECEKIQEKFISRTHISIPTTTTATSLDFKGKSWNYGTFAPPPPVAFVDTTTSAVDIDSYGFGPASPTSDKTFKTATTEITWPPSTSYQSIPEVTSAITEAGTFPPSLEEVCPSKCSKHYKPVCDTNGMTHPNLCIFQINECEFAHARCLAAKRGVVLRLLPEESCTKDLLCFNATEEICSSEIDPVCATDFITYPNMCHFRKAQCKNQEEIEILFKGDCKKCLNTPCPIVDPSNASLNESIFLCDQNGETKSKCEFEMLRCIYEIKFGYNITEAYDGRCCPRDELCPIEHKTVCASNGQHYRNTCYFNVSKCRSEKIDHVILTETECPDSIKMLENDKNCQKKNCSTEYDPVCGSDGITYTNLCNFRQKICNNKNGPKIEIEYRGACCEEKCSAVDYSPVCDSQNVTHLNICEFGKERCLTMKKEEKKIMSIVSYTVCEQVPCNVNCPAIYEPVCGSNAETFSSECELARAVCILNNAGETMLSIDYPGICCQKETCDLSFEPICDSQGRTHVNECVFRQEACLSEKKNGLNITIEHKGECCNRFCDNEKDNHPICDTNGRTHASLCEFQIQKCEAEKIGVLLNVAYMGECCPLPVEKCENSTAVCDSDGMSHRNMCEYEYKKCVIEKTQPKLLSIIHAGQCCLLDKCIDENKPVCDSRGVTHLSMCHFNNSKCVYEKVHGINNEHISLAYKDKCCEADCNNYLEPVCDQNGFIQIMLAIKMDTSSSSFGTAKPKMINGKIVWAGGPSLKQLFNLPESIMYYMARNPTTPEVYLKLIQCCKYFFEKNPILVAADMHGKTKLCPNECMKCINNDHKCCVNIDVKALFSKIWLTNMLELDKKNMSTFTLICAKLYRWKKVDLTFFDRDINLNDFEKCAPVLTSINLCVRIVKDDGNIVMLDKIVEMVPNLKKFEYSFRDDSSMIGVSTMKNLCELKNLQHLESFILECVPEIFNTEDISTFIKDHPATKMLFSFNNQVSDEYKTHLNALIDTIIESQVLKCCIHYNGQDTGKYKILYERYTV
uniref:Kazal-like domain-containing protein n=1 Tax=Panagrolaimus sp. ES5 TaxID=591445 RepID=A0AC34GVT2_9BILA